MVLVGLCVAALCAPAVAAVDLGLPPATEINFDGNGVFDQTVAGSFDIFGPLPAAIGTEVFGVGTISDVALLSDLGNQVWTPADVGPNFEMTFTFFDAVVTSSARTFVGTPGLSQGFLSADYADGARLLLVSDTSKDFDSTGGPGLFDLQDGEYPTVYTLEDAGYNDDGLADATSGFIIANDPDEEVFLDLLLSGNSSVLSFSPTVGFLGGSFVSTSIEILGGTGASQFHDFLGSDGTANAFILRFQPTSWAFGGDIDIQLKSVPEPSTLVFLGTGLASLLGYRIRRKMA